MTFYRLELQHKTLQRSCISEEVVDISVQLCKSIFYYLGNCILKDHQVEREKTLELSVTMKWYLENLGKNITTENESPRYMNVRGITFSSHILNDHTTIRQVFQFADLECNDVNPYMLINVLLTALDECLHCIKLQAKNSRQLLYVFQCTDKFGESLVTIKRMIEEKYPGPVVKTVVMSVAATVTTTRPV